jgi:hypothetical protein
VPPGPAPQSSLALRLLLIEAGGAMLGLSRRSGLGLPLAVLFCAGAITGCHQTATAPGGTARILSISPSIIDPSPAPQLVRFTTTLLSGTYSLLVIAPGGLIAEVPASQLQVISADTFQASLTLPSPGVYGFEVKSQAGDISSALELTVGNVTGFPTITAVTPSAVQASLQVQSFSVVGTAFEPGLNMVLAAPDGTIVTVSAANITVVSDTLCQASLVLNKTGSYLVTVANPSGGTSNLFPIAVTH